MPTPQERGNQIGAQLRITEGIARAAVIDRDQLDLALTRLHRLLALGSQEIGLDWDQVAGNTEIQSGGTPKTPPEQ